MIGIFRSEFNGSFCIKDDIKQVTLAHNVPGNLPYFYIEYFSDAPTSMYPTKGAVGSNIQYDDLIFVAKSNNGELLWEKKIKAVVDIN